MPMIIDDATLWTLVGGLIYGIGITVFLVYLWLKTPVGIFFSGKSILINPMSNRTIEFIKIKRMYGNTAEFKIRGERKFCLTDQKHFYLEKKSKTACGLTFGNMGITFSPIDLKYAQILEKLGIKNKKELDNLLKITNLTDEEIKKVEDTVEQQKLFDARKDFREIVEEKMLLSENFGQEKIKKVKRVIDEHREFIGD